ncbi:MULTISPECIES: hypothetical protein [Parvibaculaceae]|jgi:hypothetical protein|uniref:Uncharacterized protein n=1 Tax=Candidatus Phaeomarinibacter ectocarpi TaxID=1458461 RepID=X5MLJ3_9HYPH|nr:hypothetical protein [Candidatus Phaeomarinobacter ectocarpi]MDW3096976.1 hypothetical protein [Alphaproteobacteria bacterium]CDO58456.1 hypothetical protein BN1012_Phect242 [Candidatus Phaeomarinobacter ectocarpi]
MKKILAGAFGVAAAALIMTGSAFALDSSYEAQSKAGTHQFYVWCTGAADSETTADGANMEEAMASVQGSVGGTCKPVWQGLVN